MPAVEALMHHNFINYNYTNYNYINYNYIHCNYNYIPASAQRLGLATYCTQDEDSLDAIQS